MKFILKIKPKEYLKQGLSYCGGYAIKGILSAFRKDDGRKPENYTPFHSISTIDFIVKKLEEHGLKAVEYNAQNFTDKERLDILKADLRKNYPAILRTGNGYMPNGKFNYLQALIFTHWVSVWGFDDNKRIFYLYDSAAPLKNWKRNLPVGNVARSYDDVLRDWRLGGRFGFGIGKYKYIIVRGH